jgi:hypothetical protein
MAQGLVRFVQVRFVQNLMEEKRVALEEQH